MEIWDPQANVIQPTEMPCTLASGLSATVGNDLVAALNYVAADINSNIGAVADIAAPSSWTSLVSLSGGPLRAYILGDDPLSYSLLNSTGVKIRAQIVVDGAVVFDVTVTNVKDVALYYPQWIYCQSTLVIRAAREGDAVADASTYFKMGQSGGIAYEYVQKVS